MSKESERWYYDTLQAFNERVYDGLLKEEHILGNKKVINIGTKEQPNNIAFWRLKKDKEIYLLHGDHREKLPILVTKEKEIHYKDDAYQLILGYESAKYAPEKKLTYKQLVDDLCSFPHSNERDYTLWKIMAVASIITRINARVASEPAFGKDSVCKVLGDLLVKEIGVIANPTVAKLKYLLKNKLIMINELANLKTEDRENMEQFLLATGDMSNTYMNNSRSVGGSVEEEYDISRLSLLIAYNNLDCYPEGVKYFDHTFQQATKERFIPFKFSGHYGSIAGMTPEAPLLAERYEEYFKDYIRSIMWYKQQWFYELAENTDKVKSSKDYSLKGRWANNFDMIRNFVILYSDSAEEANGLLDSLYNRHVDYQKMVMTSDHGGLFSRVPAAVEEPLVVTEETIE